MVKSSPPKAYSYIRFSTPEQSLGDSERRQVEASREFAKRKGWMLDESLRPDRGLSGYHGVHRKKGVLGAFLKAVQSGRIERGSILIVENADRLSREGVETTLRKIVFELWDFGITLQTLSPEESYEPGCGNEVKFLALLLYLTRAHDESKRKSGLVRAARESAREKARTNGTILTARCPAWLTVTNHKFVVIAEAAKTIRKIFRWYAEGLGVREIERKLNEQSEWERRNGWRHSYVRKILSNRAVIGEYQPFTIVDEKRVATGDPISDYYPQIIDEGLLHRAQERLTVNRGTGGQNGRIGNLFKGIVFCPYCGGKGHFIDKGKGPKGRAYLVCDNGRRGVKCAKHSIRYDEVERTILENCKGLKAQTVLPNPDEQSKLCESLQRRIDGNEAKRKDIERKIQNLLDQAEDASTNNLRLTYQQRILERQAEIEGIEQTIQNDRMELLAAEQTAKSFKQWQADLGSLRKALGKKDDVELRMRMQNHLRGLIDKIEIWTDGFAKVYDSSKDKQKRITAGTPAWRKLTAEQLREQRKPGYRDGCETIADEMYERQEDPDPKFIKWVAKQRMSKRGRFVRVFWQTGIWTDFVPEGSIASGLMLYVDEDGKQQWGHVAPNFDRLHGEFDKV